MKSTIKIALGLANEPVIRFEVRPSDDIRDQLCCQFLHALGGDSNLCSVSIRGTDTIGEPLTHTLEISPISPIHEGFGHWNNHLEFITSLHAIELTIREQKNLAWVSLLVGGDMIYWENNKESPATYSKEYSRRELYLLHRCELVRKVMEILDSVDTWKPFANPTKLEPVTT